MPEAALASETPDEEILYPESDGAPMAETDDHRDEISELVFTLKRHFKGRDDVYISGNLLVYYEEGDPKKRRAPDVFVVLDVPVHQRRTYRLWEEGEAPIMAIELTSKGTKTEDEKRKPAIYAKMGIEYLFLYDVLGEYLEPALQGKRLGPDGSYHPLVGPRKGPFPCPPLGLDLILDGNNRLQFVDQETGEVVVRVLLELDQTVEALREAEERVEQAEDRVNQGLRQSVEDLCIVLGLAWAAEKSAQVKRMSASQLETLRQHLVQEKSWPESFPDAPSCAKRSLALLAG